MAGHVVPFFMGLVLGVVSLTPISPAQAQQENSNGIELVITSGDSFADVIDRSVSLNGDDKTVTLLEDMANASEAGSSIDLPGVSNEPSKKLATAICHR